MTSCHVVWRHVMWRGSYVTTINTCRLEYNMKVHCQTVILDTTRSHVVIMFLDIVPDHAASFDFLWSRETFMLIDISFLKARFSPCKRFPKMSSVWMRSSRRKEMNKEMKEACRSFHTFYRNIFLTAVLHIMPASAWHHGPSAHGWT